MLTIAVMLSLLGISSRWCLFTFGLCIYFPWHKGRNGVPLSICTMANLLLVSAIWISTVAIPWYFRPIMTFTASWPGCFGQLPCISLLRLHFGSIVSNGQVFWMRWMPLVSITYEHLFETCNAVKSWYEEDCNHPSLKALSGMFTHNVGKVFNELMSYSSLFNQFAASRKRRSFQRQMRTSLSIWRRRMRPGSSLKLMAWQQVIMSRQLLKSQNMKGLLKHKRRWQLVRQCYCYKCLNMTYNEFDSHISVWLDIVWNSYLRIHSKNTLDSIGLVQACPLHIIGFLYHLERGSDTP